MATTMSPQFEEKRFALRMGLRLPIVVSGRADDGAAWSEPTETDDISTTGTLFHLNQQVSEDENLYLRSHRPDGVPVEVKARLCELRRHFTAHRASVWKLSNQKKIGFAYLLRGLLMTKTKKNRK